MTKRIRRTWPKFREMYMQKYASGFQRNTIENIKYALDKAEELIDPQYAEHLLNLHDFYMACLEDDMSRGTAMTYVKKVRGMLQWGIRQKLVIGKITEPDIPRRLLEKRLPKEPVSEEHLQILFNERCRGRPDWEFLCRGLLYSGMRIEEAEVLQWDAGPFRVALTKPHAFFHVLASADKAKCDRYLPMVNEFRELLETVPTLQRQGYVFMPQIAAAEDRHKLRVIAKTIGGRQLRKIIHRRIGPHDYRRTFASRWALLVPPVVLKELMRHSTIDTTMRYYVRVESARVAVKIDGVRAFTEEPISPPKVQLARVDHDPRTCSCEPCRTWRQAVGFGELTQAVFTSPAAESTAAGSSLAAQS